ncbi:MAG: Trk system potassium transporter TrkA [Clostridia bacterium]|nr:Trk system potassium transporter TrkA [Clostridia bacterium]
MHIIIVGGGGVGYELARNLSEKRQDVVVVEQDELKAKRFKESLDVMVIEDNGANAAVLEQANIKTANMLIAVTQSDEVNIIACMLAKKYNVPITVCRIRNSGYAEESSVLTPNQLGIDIVINPERVAAMEISKMLHFPEASEVEYFNRGKVMMLGVVVGPEAEITDVPLHKLPLNANCIIVGISDSEGKFIVPGGNDVIRPGNKIYLLGDTRTLKDISSLLHHEKMRVTQVTILGGGMIALYLAKLLEESKQHFSVKIIERNEARCEKLCRHLDKTLVLQGDATEIAMLKEEDTDKADAVIAATGDDPSNIVAALLARQFGVKKIICEVMKPQYVPVYSALGIDSVINPRLLAAAQIIRFTRREEVVALSILQDEKAEITEIILPETAKVVHKKISEANLPRGMLIGSLVRKGEVIIPNGNTVLLPHDHLIVFAIPKVSAKLDRYFAQAAGNGDRENLRNKVIQIKEV